jgi:hypothetical protein
VCVMCVMREMIVFVAWLPVSRYMTVSARTVDIHMIGPLQSIYTMDVPER